VYNYILRVPQEEIRFSIEFTSDLPNAIGYYYRNNQEYSFTFNITGIDRGYKYNPKSTILSDGSNASLAIAISDFKGNGAVYTINIVPESEPLTERSALQALSYRTALNAQAVALDVSSKDFQIDVDESVSNLYLQAGKKNPNDIVAVNGNLLPLG
jgi:hypothetical protein